MSHERNEGLEGQRAEIRARLAAPEDEDGLRRLLEWNDAPRRLAVEKCFLVAQQGEAVLAALEYRVVGRILLLGPLFSGPWGLERLPARVLYAEAHTLAREAGLQEVRAAASPWSAYPHEVRYRRWGRVWRVDPAKPLVLRGELPKEGWHRVLTLLRSPVIPFFRPSPRRAGDVPERTQERR